MGPHVATAGYDGTARVWDAESGGQIAVLRPGAKRVEKVAWSPDGTRLALATGGATTTIWDTATWQQATVLDSASRDMAWSPDGRRLALAGWYAIAIWDVDSGTMAKVPEANPYLVRWSPRGDRLASGHGDQILRIWDAATLERLAELPGHTSFLYDLAWNADGTRLASCSHDNTVKLWDTATGREIITFRNSERQVPGVAWGPDPFRLACVDHAGILRVFDARGGYARERSALLLPDLDRDLAADPEDIKALGAAEGDPPRGGRGSGRRGGPAAIGGRLRETPQGAARPPGTPHRLRGVIAGVAAPAVDRGRAGHHEVGGGRDPHAQEDGSVLATGTDRGGDVYALAAVSGLDRIAAVRLEALPDEGLPQKGPGRHPSGNFQLAGVRLFRPARDGSNGRTPVPIADAWASYAYQASDADIAGTIDEHLGKVWHVWGRFGEAHEAIFLLPPADAIGRGQPFTIELRHKDETPGLNLGRYRLSVSDRADAVLGDRLELALSRGDLSGPAALGAVRYLRGELAGVERALAPVGEDAGALEWSLLALAQHGLDRPEQARRSYERAVAWLARNRPDPLGRAAAYQAMKDVAKLSPARAADLLASLEDEASLVPLNTAIEQRSDRLEGYLARGWWYASRGMWSRAHTDLCRGYEGDPTSEGSAAMGAMSSLD